MAEPYEVYVDRYCRVKSGQKLNPDDFGFVDDVGFQGFDEVRKLAFSLAADDADNNRPMRLSPSLKGSFTELVRSQGNKRMLSEDPSLMHCTLWLKCEVFPCVCNGDLLCIFFKIFSEVTTAAAFLDDRREFLCIKIARI